MYNSNSGRHNNITLCLCSSALPQEMQDKLAESFRVISLPPDESIAPPVSSHPDMLCSVTDEEKRIFFPKSYAERYHAVVSEIAQLSGYQAMLTDIPRSSVYPHDCGLNAAIGHDFIICRHDSLSPELLECAGKTRRVISVRQGYSGCSCIVTENAVLTSDPGIHAALSTAGIPVCFCDNHGIRLPGYDIGFIGGCGGYFDKALYFFGDPDLTAAGEAIHGFAARYGLKTEKLGGGVLTDYGGLKFLPII